MVKKNIPGDVNLPSSKEEIQKFINIEEKNNWKYSVEDFFRNPETSGFKISPDGKYISYLSPYERRKNIFVRKIGQLEGIRITSEIDRDIDGYTWANNNRLIYIKDEGGNENFSLYAVDKNGSNQKNLTPFENIRIEIIDDLEEIEDELIIGMNKNNPMLFEPYRININTGQIAQLATNDNVAEPISGWITDHEGDIRIAIKMKDGINTCITYRENPKGEFKEVITTNFKEQLQPLFFEFDNSNIIFASSNINRDKEVIIRFDLNEGKEIGEIIFGHPEVDVTRLGYSKKRKVLTSVSYTTEKRNYYFLDEKVKTIFDFLESKLKGKEIVIVDHDKEENIFIVRTYSDKSLGSYYLYNDIHKTLDEVAKVSPWLEEEEMSDQNPFEYLSRDGLKIHGYLTIPKGVKVEKLPLIVHPHGGPWHRDVWGFSQEIQLFADRGFAVLQINFRGSTGYGRSFWEAGFKKWGREMQNDITDGVLKLINDGIADPNKIAIYGGSYGGYATLAGICYTPELYSAAVDYVGVSNLFTFLNTIPPYWKPYLDMMYEMVGHPEQDQEYLSASSPALNADKIKTPLFVVQGANDPRVNIDEADQIVRTLRNNGTDVLYMVKYDEGHGFRKEENRFEFYKSMLGFLIEHLNMT